jgi:hypothetical protein
MEWERGCEADLLPVERGEKVPTVSQNETQQVVGPGIIGLVLQSQAEFVFRTPQVSIRQQFHGLHVLRLSAGSYRWRCTLGRASSGELFQNEAQAVIPKSGAFGASRMPEKPLLTRI